MPPRQRFSLLLFIPLTAAALILLGALWARPTPQAPDDFYLTNSIYLSAAGTQWLALIALAPLFVALAFVWQTEKPASDFLQPEMVGVFGWWVAFANGYAVAYILSLAGLSPKFDPALQSLNDPRLRAAPVNYAAITLVAATTAFFIWFIFGRRSGFGGLADRINLPHRRAALLILLTMLAVTVWLFGGLDFALLMIPPAWFWIQIEPRPNRWERAMNATLAIGGIAALGIMYALLPRGLNLWRLLVAAASGALYPIDVLMFFLLVALFIRFLRLGWSTPYAPPREPDAYDPLAEFFRDEPKQ